MSMHTYQPRKFADSGLGTHSISDRSEVSWWMMQGEIRHLATVLTGRTAVIELDPRTGYTAQVIIEGTGTTGLNGTAALRVRHFDSTTGQPGEGDQFVTLYRLTSVGTIMVLDGEFKDHSDVTASIWAEGRAAIDKVKADHPECTYGKWTSSPQFRAGHVHVVYEPQREGAGERVSAYVEVALASA